MSNSHQFNQEKPLLVDFKQQGASLALFPNPPLLTSLQAGWDGIHFEYHHQPAHDTSKHCLTMHTISIALDAISSQRWFNGHQESEYQTKGTTAIIPAGTLHRCLWEQDVQFMFVAINPMLLVHLGVEVTAPEDIELIPHFATFQDPLILGIMSSLKDELESTNQGDNLYVEQLKTTLVIHLLKKYCVRKPHISTYPDGLSKFKLRQILEYIHTHVDSEIKLTTLAQVAGISQYYFCQLFKQSLGITPYQYVLQLRVERAKQLLKNQKITICDVALACGFANQSHFTKHFRKLTGMTPKAYWKHSSVLSVE
ncbi:AraC family transcriptional regulator [Brasilonema sp. UFV-L1]|uniref:helix-turn-helix transcriptional regulator n=1 Tax=Brasilonema sp. UFV-L1 TaxID=2234130 RepID=UPI00145D0F6D|nr:AraC family transcriptional regulator [Brasilonema sp. UFV-L1]NMG05619.1 AraC family transcriptional regulator [Brasilonema sp. UFV-L1]